MKNPLKRDWKPGTMQVAFFTRFDDGSGHPGVVEYVSTKPIEETSAIAHATRLLCAAAVGGDVWKIAARGLWLRIVPTDVLNALCNALAISGATGPGTWGPGTKIAVEWGQHVVDELWRRQGREEPPPSLVVIPKKQPPITP